MVFPQRHGSSYICAGWSISSIPQHFSPTKVVFSSLYLSASRWIMMNHPPTRNISSRIHLFSPNYLSKNETKSNNIQKNKSTQLRISLVFIFGGLSLGMSRMLFTSRSLAPLLASLFDDDGVVRPQELRSWELRMLWSCGLLVAPGPCHWLIPHLPGEGC